MVRHQPDEGHLMKHPNLGCFIFYANRLYNPISCEALVDGSITVN